MRKKILAILLLISSARIVDAQSWSPVGTGIGSTSTHSVRTFATYNGELYVGGFFDEAGNIPANNIAKWNGTNWSAIDAGIVASVSTLCVLNGELYAGGSFYFSTPGGIEENSIARWNGTTWSPVGNIVAYDIKAMAVFNGELYAAGWFPNFYSLGTPIAKWNGSSWTSVIPEDDFHMITVESMAAYNGNLYVAGAYYQIGGGGVPEFYKIIKWDGFTWSTLITIPPTYTLDGALGDVLSMTVYNSELYIAGTFSSIDTFTTGHIARWNGINWSAVGSGIKPASYALGDGDGSIYTFVKALGVYNGALYATGWFDSSGSIATHNIAKWNGNNWTNLNQGINGHGYSLWGTDTCLFVGGWFNSVDGFNILPANNIAKWKDSCLVPSPTQPAIIYGDTLVCQGSVQTYSIDIVPDATSYSWTLPPGWSANSNSATITATAGSYGGEIKVIVINSCGSSIPKTMAVTVNPLPIQLSEIYGNNVVCAGSTGTYSTNQVPGTYYTWNLPQGWIGTSTTSSITTIAGTSDGTISVIANNTCGSSNTQTLEVTIDSLPPQPGLITGSDSLCQLTSQLYSVDPVSGATSYTWNLPTGWSGFSNSNSITVETGLNSGFISVVANNNCGASIPQTILVTTEAVPAMPVFINGNDTVCEGSSQTYFIDAVPGATGYAWDLTFGTAFGFDSTTITITALHSGYPNDFITVSAYNNCGNSDMLTLLVKVNDLPYQPNRIFGNNLVCRGSNQTYFIDTVPGATSYTWMIPTGWIGNSNTSSINVNVGNETGNISVRANNSCGSGAFVSLPVLFDTIPAKPGTINGNVYVAAGEKHGYSVDITIRPPGYNWSLSGGGNLTAGQSPHKIEIDWQTPGTYVLSVNAVNSCGVSTEQKINITVSGANEKDPYSLQLYPNPSTGQFFLKAKRIQDKLINVAVLNMAGQLVFLSGKKQGTNDYSQLINLDKMAIGLYAVKIMIDDKTYVRSVMINH